MIKPVLAWSGQTENNNSLFVVSSLIFFSVSEVSIVRTFISLQACLCVMLCVFASLYVSLKNADRTFGQKKKVLE